MLGECVVVGFPRKLQYLVIVLSLFSKCEVNRKTVGTAGKQGQTFSAQQPKFGETLLLYTKTFAKDVDADCNTFLCNAMKANTAHALQLDIGSTP